MPKVDYGRRDQDGPKRHSSVGPVPDTVQCQTCGDAGFVRLDVEVHHPDFGAAVPCPHCEGALKPRNRRAEALWHLHREQATRPRLPDAFVSASGAMPEPPPEGFAVSGIPVPSTVSDEQREAARKFIAKNIAGVAAKMKVGER